MRVLLVPAIFIVFGLSALTFFGEYLEFPENISELAPWLKSFKEDAWWVGSALIIGDSVLPLPTDPTTFSFGIIYGAILGGLIGGTAATLAGLIGYSIARLFGERGAVFLLGEKDLQRARHFYHHWGFITIALGRAIGGPAEYLVVVAGLTPMPFYKVLLAIITGAFTAAFCMATLGALAITQPLLATITASVLVLSLILGFSQLQKNL